MISGICGIFKKCKSYRRGQGEKGLSAACALGLQAHIPRISPNISIYLNIFSLGAVLAVLCCVGAFSSCGERICSLAVVCRLLIAVTSLVVKHGL